MRELLDQIPTGYWVVGIVAYILGAATVWHFARYVERLHISINNMRHHLERAKTFGVRARDTVVGFAVSGAIVSAIFLGVGYLAYLRVS